MVGRHSAVVASGSADENRGTGLPAERDRCRISWLLMTADTAQPTQTRPKADRVEVRFAARAVVGVTALSAVAGIVWGLLAPAQHFLVVSGGGAVSLTGESIHQFDAMALFVCFGLVVGVLSAVAVWARRELRGVVQFAGLLVGSLVGAAAAAVVGEGVVGIRYPSLDDLELGQIVAAPPGIGTLVALIAQPLAAAVVYAALVSFSPDPNLGRAADSSG
ncbi:hypothetical protein G419_08019 [Rhodococcus triatomae BKS 15-14]|nr:hypothetical protein G419_08019 [Rhodococcus triatomae BKS 15-14]